ncbi:MAG: sulfatase-like hydrolase/transferase [Desulfuromonadaceae bacterium]
MKKDGLNLVKVCLHSLSWIDWTSDLALSEYLKKLSFEGSYFPNALAQSTNCINSFPVEYSGCYYHRSVRDYNLQDGLPPQIDITDEGQFMQLPDTIFERLDEAGYDWKTCMEGHFNNLMPRVLEDQSAQRFSNIMKKNINMDESISFLETWGQQEQPKAMMFQIYDTHRPWRLNTPPYFRFKAMDAFGLNNGELPEEYMGARWAAINEPDNLSTIRRVGLAYATFQVERIMKALERADVLDRTIVLIYSNHGEVYDHFRHSKKLKLTCVSHGDVMMFDALEHTFQIWLIPNQNPALLPHRVRVVDIVPTIIDLLQLPETAKRDGKSISGIIFNPHSESINHRESFCLSPKAYSYRSDSMKLYHCNNDDSYYKDALFDTSWDRAERLNLMSFPAYQDHIDNLSSRLTDLLSK